jgi:dTDP-4-amino-4,6-dideoxygalactose transaminase
VSAAIPFEDMERANRPFAGELRAAFERVLARGRYVLGAEGAAFEQEFAAALGGGHAVGTGSGTDALTLAFMGLGIAQGEVILPVNSCMATALAVVRCGLTPVFSDPRPGTFLFDPADAGSRVTPRTVALLPVHLFGLPCDMGAVLALAERHGLAVVEDCAQAHGASWRGKAAGTFGHAAAFSFYPTKNLGALGDGGALATADPALADRVRVLRNSGARERCRADVNGMNSRLDEVQAAFLRAKLPHLPAIVAKKNLLASLYDGGLSPAFARPRPVEGAGAARHLYPVLHPGRERLRAHLAARGIGTEIHYPLPLHRHPAFAHFGDGEYPAAERLHRDILSLPLSFGHSEEEIAAVIGEANGFAAGFPFPLPGPCDTSPSA